MAQPLIPASVKGEIPFNEPSEVRVCLKSEAILLVPHPAMELCPDQSEIFRRCAALALPNRVGILTPKPGLDRVGVLFLANVLKSPDSSSPNLTGLVTQIWI